MYYEIYTAATDSAFQGRCLVAMWKTAQGVMDEDPATPDHATRVEWATKALTDRTTITARQLSIQVLRNLPFNGDPWSSLDSDIQDQTDAVLPSLIALG